MKKVMLIALSLVFMNFAFAQHDGHALTNAKIAHDASHRVGRLVDTGKLDEVFIKNMSSLEVKVLPHNQHTDPAFSVLASAGSDSQTLLTFDMSGKFLTNKVIGQGTAQETPWEVDSSEILEAALHYAMEATIPNVDVKPFTQDLSKASLKQQKSDDGVVQPIVELTSSSTTKVLQINLTSKGVVVSASVIE